MLKDRKGIGTGTIMKLVLALMTASLFIGAGTVGSLGTALEEGFNNMGESTDYRIDLNAENEDEAKEKLSQAAKFVRMRAGNQGCAEDADAGSFRSVPKYVEEENGFEALEDTYIGRYPTCESSTSTLSRGIKGGIKDLGSDQEGIYSRVSFQVVGDSSEDHEINLDTGSPNTWLEGKDTDAGITAIKKGSLESATQKQCSREIIEAAVEGGATGAVLGSSSAFPIGIAGSATIGAVSAGVFEYATGARFVGTGNRWVIFVRPEDMDDRVNKWVDNADNGGGASYGYENRLYCHAITDGIDWGNIFNGDPMFRSPLRGAYNNHYNGEVEMRLCPGDEGYIQMNKGKPQNDAEAGEDWLSGASKYPYIEITEKGSCEGEGGGSGGGGSDEPAEPISGTVTTDPATNRTDENPDVIQESGSSLTFDPGQSSDYDDYLAYQPLPEGSKNVTVKVEFSERGHFQIEAQKYSGDFAPYGSEAVSYMNTDPEGSSDLWIQKASGGYEETDVDYETGKTYTFNVERVEGNVSWTVKEEDSEIFNSTSEGQDFRRLHLKSWQDYAGSSANPVVEIKEVSVEDN